MTWRTSEREAKSVDGGNAAETELETRKNVVRMFLEDARKLTTGAVTEWSAGFFFLTEKVEN